MPFIQLHKLCSYLVVLTGFFVLLLPNVLHPIAWPLTLIAALVSWRFEKPRIQSPRYRKMWGYFTAIVFFGTLFLTLLRIIENPIFLAAYLLILLQINKLFNRLGNRDYLQIYVISFLMLTLSSILNTNLSYAICFLLYIIFTTWTLTLFHLRREIEETYLMRHDEEQSQGEKVEVEQILRSRRLVKGSFLASASLIALAVFASSSLIFMLFPRVGFGMFFHRQRLGPQMTGFSNEVKLGSFGTIRQNRQVIMRVELPEQKPQKRLLHYWRGTSFDYYDGTSWKRSLRRYKNARYMMPWSYLQPMNGAQKKRMFRKGTYQIIYREPINTTTLFGIERVTMLRLPMGFPEKLRFLSPRVRVDLYSGNIQSSQLKKQGSSLRYEVLSMPQTFRPSFLPKNMRETITRLYTQMPNKLSPKVKELATRITRNARTPIDKARAIVNYLRNNYRYSLTRQRPKTNPVEDFLFHQKIGHCEYFSTSMIILLRAVDIPARQVTGFLGGTWNSYGNYYAVRQSDAHSWVEVFMPQRHGWQRFDPSPSAAPTSSWNGWRQIEDWIDSLRLRWHKWVIEYDLVHQIGALRAIQKQFKRASDTFSFASPSKRILTIAGGLILALLIAGGIVFYFMRRSTKHASPQHIKNHPVSTLYVKALALLAKHGMPRLPHETPNEYLQRIQLLRDDITPPLAQITHEYLSLRYNPKHPPQQQEQLRDGLQHIQRILQPPKTSS